MRFEQGIALDFCDVLLKPKRSTIESRKEIVLDRSFKFLHGEFDWTGVPVISSNMTSVTTPEVAKIMDSHQMLACSPKNLSKSFFGVNGVIRSIGLNDKIPGTNSIFLCLDVPNANIETVVNRTKELRKQFPLITLIVGNVVTAEMTEALILAGADIVKVGIGSGAACSTRIKTGVGMPQLSAVIECADAAHGLGGHIISDGGCTTPADIVKAFSGGADFVMLGSMLAGHDENGEDFYGMSSERGNNELAGFTCNLCHGIGETRSGGLGDHNQTCSLCKGVGKIEGLKDYRAAEGWEMKLPKKGPLENTLKDIEGGLRSACAYVGAKQLKDLPKCATFVQVNRVANTSLWDFRS